MDRKLNHSLVALSASGLFLVAALLVANPVDQGGQPSPGDATASAPAPAADAGGTRPGGSGAVASRRGLALPYFSFARGMRRIGG